MAILTKKIVLVGSEQSGKSALRERIINNKFPQLYVPTIGADYSIKTVEKDGNEFKLQIWDISGQERFQSLRPSFFRGSDAMLLFCDLTNANSLDQLSKHLATIQDHSKTVPVFLVATKSDMEPQIISDNDLIAFVETHQLKGFYKTSAKANLGTDEVTNALIHHFEQQLNLDEQIEDKNSDSSVLVHSSDKNSSNSRFYLNCSMAVLGGFVAAIGIAAVAVALVVLSGPVSIGVAAVAGVAALLGLGFFARGIYKSCSNNHVDYPIIEDHAL